MKALLLVVLLALAGCIHAADWSWSSCGSGAYTISSITMTPDPPQPGANITFMATGVLSEVVTGGNIVVKTYWDGFLVKTLTDTVCAIANCPVPRGTWVTGKPTPIPSFSPSGSYTANSVMTDQSGKLLACINVDFTLS